MRSFEVNQTVDRKRCCLTDPLKMNDNVTERIDFSEYTFYCVAKTLAIDRQI